MELCRVFWHTGTNFSEASPVSVFVIEENDDGGTRFLRNASSYLSSHEILVFTFTTMQTARATSQLLKSFSNTGWMYSEACCVPVCVLLTDFCLHPVCSVLSRLSGTGRNTVRTAVIKVC